MDRNSACKTKMHPVYLNIVWLNWWTLSKIGDISFMRGECMYLLIRNGKYSNTFCTNTNIFVTLLIQVGYMQAFLALYVCIG